MKDEFFFRTSIPASMWREINQGVVMEKIRKPTKAEIAEGRRSKALDYAVRLGGNGVEVVKNAKAIENYLAGKKGSAR